MSMPGMATTRLSVLMKRQNTETLLIFLSESGC